MSFSKTFLSFRTLAWSLGVLPAALVPGAVLSATVGGSASPYRLHADSREYRLRLPAPGTAAVAAKRGLAGLVDRHARARSLDPALVHAVIRAESAYRPDAVSEKGAVGLMQVMPDTGRRFGVTDLLNPDANLRAGTAYLSHLLQVFGDLPLALAAYNAGEGAVLRHGGRIPPYAETRAYVRNVLSSYSGKVSAAAPRHYADGLRLDRRRLLPYRLRQANGSADSDAF